MKVCRLILLIFALVGCSADIPEFIDPAEYIALQNQPDDYGGLARIAHQYANRQAVVAYLEKRNYRCSRLEKIAPAPNGQIVTDCRYAGIDLLPGIKTVYLLSQSGVIRKAVGRREFPAGVYPLFLKKRFDSKFSPPGINFPNIQRFADFVANNLEIANTNNCLDADAVWPGSQAECRQWRDKRRQGWPRWEGHPVDADSIAAAVSRLRRKGFDCPEFPAGHGVFTASILLDKNTVWLQCENRSLSGQMQRVLLGLRLEDSALYRLRVELDTDRQDIPLKTVAPNSHVSDRNVIVQTDDGTVKTVSLIIEKNRNLRDLDISSVDFDSRRRLLSATVWQAGIVDETYRELTSIPKLQQLDRLAYLFVRLGPKVLNEWRTALKELKLELLASIVIAECMQGNANQAAQCFLSHLAADPRLAPFFTEAIAEIEPYAEGLSNEHTVKKRLNMLSNALMAYRHFLIASTKMESPS